MESRDNFVERVHSKRTQLSSANTDMGARSCTCVDALLFFLMSTSYSQRLITP
ncbi:hypothetical protein GBA52_014690 [Prunus armeniaca]|nr:hypothetical protein GBA52_014690 [Prunus armeniaca]